MSVDKGEKHKERQDLSKKQGKKEKKKNRLTRNSENEQKL